jgi:signal transduction histidine kinase
VRTEPYYNNDGRIIKWYGISIDIEDNKLAKEKIQKTTRQLRELSGHLQKVREEERTNISREIHDELGGQLTVLKMDASWLNKKLSDSHVGIQQKMKNLIEILDSMIVSVRRISSELRPSLLDKIGLVATIDWHLKEFEKRSGIVINFDAPKKELSLPDEVKNGLFRIFQESLTNVARHSEATKLKVVLHQSEEQVVLTITDDGIGFDKQKLTEAENLGILGMQERTLMMKGTYNITSTPGNGTSVKIIIPYKKDAVLL